MYFTAEMQGGSHVWQQRFPEGEPEQLTFGPTEEDGIAIEPGVLHSLITSVGVHESCHFGFTTQRGEHSLSSEGEVFWWPTPVFKRWRLERHLLPAEAAGNLGSGAVAYDALIRGKAARLRVFRNLNDRFRYFAGRQTGGIYNHGCTNRPTELWLAPVDRSSPATKVEVSGAQWPRSLEGKDRSSFQRAEEGTNFLEQIGFSMMVPISSKVLPYPIDGFSGYFARTEMGNTLSPQDRGGQFFSGLVLVSSRWTVAPRRSLCVNYC